ncbi:MAG: type 4a pilus biogenesis protein PilO [Candidatus Omnitrophota bacterium]
MTFNPLEGVLKFVYKLKIYQRLILALLTMFLCCYAVYNSLISAQLINLNSIKKQLMVQANLIESKREKTKQLLQLEDGYNKLREDINKKNMRFFSDEEAIDFFKNLNKLVGQDSGNELIFIKPLSEDTIGESLIDGARYIYKRSDVQLIISGGFSSIYELFKKLSDFNKVISIKDFDIELKQSENMMLKSDFVLSIYILSHKEEKTIENNA